jgi:hypothetical protein
MNQPVTFITPAYTYTPSSSSTTSSHFMARPVKHWRKQLLAGPCSGTASPGYSRASMGMPMDRPGASTTGLTGTGLTGTGTGTGTSAIPLTAEIIKFVCQTRIKANTQFSETSYPDTQSFLKARCQSFVQNQSTIRAPGTINIDPEGYITPIDNLPTGPQVRSTTNCKTACTTSIYKPNNIQFAEQGAVSGHSRLARLKYNISNNNGAAFNSAYGALAVNRGQYLTEPTPSYYIKPKPHRCVAIRKPGALKTCSVSLNSA